MPKTTIDYSKCVMYRIVCNDVSIPDCYVGHTTNLTKRRCQHKSTAKHPYNAKRKLYTFVRENGGFDNFSFVEIEKYPCKTYDEAVARERYWIETYKASLNSILYLYLADMKAQIQ